MHRSRLYRHDGQVARIQFESILSHRGEDPTSPLYPLAHLGVARAAMLINDAGMARKGVRGFPGALERAPTRICRSETLERSWHASRIVTATTCRSGSRRSGTSGTTASLPHVRRHHPVGRNALRRVLGTHLGNERMLPVAAKGRFVSHTPEAQARRVAARRRNALAEAAWKPSDQPGWLTERGLHLLPFLSSARAAERMFAKL